MLVLGGGIGGLSAAHYLLKSGLPDVKIIEAAKAVGGWIRSPRDSKTGVLFEQGPRTIRVNTGPNTLALLEELKLDDKVKPITLNHPSAKNRMIYVNNQLWVLPNEFKSFFKTVPPFSKPMALSFLRDIFIAKKPCDDDSVYGFVERRFGKEIADYLISPLICGICAGDAKEISVKFLMRGMFEAEQKYGSAVKGMVYNMLQSAKKVEPTSEPVCQLVEKAKKEKWSVFGLEGGLEVLPNTMRESVLNRKGQIICESPVTKISFKKGYAVCKMGNDDLKSDHLICSLPSRAVAPLVRDEHPKLAELLSSIPYVTVSVVNLVYRGKVMDYNAFGFLIPPSQNLPILGVIFDSCNFPEDDYTVLTVMLGGKWFDKHIGSNKSDNDILKLVTEQLKVILGIQEEPESAKVSILKECIPQYLVGHYDRVDKIYSYIKETKLPITLIGSSYRGVGVNDVILSAKTGVNELSKNL